MTHKIWKSGFCYGAALVAILLATDAHAQQRTFNLPEQDATKSIPEFARQAGIQISAPAEALKGMRTPPINGELDVREALERLLKGTGLAVASDQNGMIVLREVTASSNSSPGTGEGDTAKSGMRIAQASEDEQNKDRSSGKKGEPQDTKLGEIVVTATRRAESMRNVPLSIAVVTAQDIDRRGLVNAEDYLRGIPSTNQVQGVTGQSIVIRGIETNTVFQGFRASATTATYFGETPTTDSAGLVSSNVDIKLVDIERVEVLRGPQGTAFGSSSMGGAVRTIPVSPKLDSFHANMAVGYSVTSGSGSDNYNVQAVGNLPLVRDKFAIRATGYRYQESGFYNNRAGSDPTFQTTWTAPFGGQAFAVNKNDVGAYYTLGGRVAALYQANENLRLTFNYLKQETETDGWALANNGTYEQTLPQVAPEHVRRGETGGVLDTSIDIANAVAEYSFGWADLLATYSYLKGETLFMQPYVASGLNWAASAGRDSDFQRDVGEIRLATRLQGAWNFLGGLYVESNKDNYLSDVYWYGNPAAANVVCAACAGQRLLLNALDRRDLEQKALFGEASWEFLPGLTLTGGVRAYEYERTFRLDQYGALAGGTPPPTRFEGKASGENFRANLSYKPGDDTLLYAGWTQGFRFGRPQAGLSAALCDRNPADGLIDGTNVTIESTREIAPDEVDSYELGGKWALFDRRVRLDAAVFRMDWSDIPVSVVHLSACPSGYTANAGSALSEGVELQANLQLTDALRMDVGGSWVDARLTENVPAQGFFDGDRLPGSPKVNANLGLQYEFAIGGHEASVRADSIYVGPFFGDVLESPNTRSGDYVKLDVSTRVAMGNLNVDLFVRNLTNEDAFTFRGAFSFTSAQYGYRMRPRTVGLQLSYTF